MKFLLLLIVGLCGTIQAGVYTQRYFRDENFPGKCVVDGKVLRPGQSIKHPTMECAEVTCDNSIGMATIETCDPISALPPPLQSFKSCDLLHPRDCVWGDFKDTKAAFPKCCERHLTCTF